MAKLQEVKGRFSISIPKLMVKKKGWQKGQEILLSFDQEGNIVLIEV